MDLPNLCLVISLYTCVCVFHFIFELLQCTRSRKFRLKMLILTFSNLKVLVSCHPLCAACVFVCMTHLLKFFTEDVFCLVTKKTLSRLV